MRRVTTTITIAATALALLMLSACAEGPGASSGSSTIRPPTWLHGFWICDAGADCYNPAIFLWTGFGFVEDGIRTGTPDSNLRAFGPGVAGSVRQTTTDDTYTVTHRLFASQTYIYRWQRTSNGLLFTFKATGDYTTSVGPLRYVRQE